METVEERANKLREREMEMKMRMKKKHHRDEHDHIAQVFISFLIRCGDSKWNENWSACAGACVCLWREEYMMNSDEWWKEDVRRLTLWIL